MLLKNIYVGVMWTKMAQNMVYWQEVVKVCEKKKSGFYRSFEEMSSKR